MLSYADIVARAARDYLNPVGAFHPTTDDKAPEGCQTLVLLGPKEPGFWAQITTSSEMRDGRPEPIDRWSTRVVTAMAEALGAEPFFPFTGPPWHPFIAWAKATGHVWSSPVTLLVHETAGLMLSVRGALAFPTHIALPDLPGTRPCATCGAPCTTACPVDALSASGYDTAACHAYLDTEPGQDCLTNGCAARRACPVSQSYGRDAAQSAFHMAAFHP